MAMYWISFADPEKPAGSQFAGVLILEAADEEAALAKAETLGQPPKITIEDITHRDPPRKWLGRILSAKESRDLNRIMCLKAQQQHEED